MVERSSISYNNREAKTYRLIITSHTLSLVWKSLGTRKNQYLIGICYQRKGNIQTYWREISIGLDAGKPVKTKMFLYGCLPFSGVHTLYFERIDEQQKVLATKESDAVCKAWNHSIFIEKTENNSILVLRVLRVSVLGF